LKFGGTLLFYVRICTSENNFIKTEMNDGPMRKFSKEHNPEINMLT